MPGPLPLPLVAGDAALRASLVEQILWNGAFRPDEAEAKAKLAQADARHDVILLSSLLTATGGYLLKAYAEPAIVA